MSEWREILRVHMDSETQLFKENTRLSNQLREVQEENEQLRTLLVRSLTLLEADEDDIYRFHNDGDGYGSANLATDWEESRDALVSDIHKTLGMKVNK